MAIIVSCRQVRNGQCCSVLFAASRGQGIDAKGRPTYTQGLRCGTASLPDRPHTTVKAAGRETAAGNVTSKESTSRAPALKGCLQRSPDLCGNRAHIFDASEGGIATCIAGPAPAASWWRCAASSPVVTLPQDLVLLLLEVQPAGTHVSVLGLDLGGDLSRSVCASQAILQWPDVTWHCQALHERLQGWLRQKS